MIEPERQLKRLAVQQGLFLLLPLNLNTSFIDNIAGTAFDSDAKHPKIVDRSKALEKHIVKLLLKAEVRDKGLSELGSMNITAETLFPGIDGFASSLIQTVIAT